MLQKLAGEKVQVHCNRRRRPKLIAVLCFSAEVTVGLYVANTVPQLKQRKLMSSYGWSECGQQQLKQSGEEKRLWINVNMTQRFV